MSLEVSIALRAEQDMTLQYVGIWKMPTSTWPNAICWPCMKRSNALPSSRAWGTAATFSPPNSLTFAVFRSKDLLTATCSFTWKAIPFVSNASCTGHAIFLTACRKILRDRRQRGCGVVPRSALGPSCRQIADFSCRAKELLSRNYVQRG